MPKPNPTASSWCLVLHLSILNRIAQEPVPGKPSHRNCSVWRKPESLSPPRPSGLAQWSLSPNPTGRCVSASTIGASMR
jgi:hypothetical protein